MVLVTSRLVTHAASLLVLLLVAASTSRTTQAQTAEHVILQTHRNLQNQEAFNLLIGDELQNEFVSLFAHPGGHARTPGEPSAPIPDWLKVLLKWLKQEAALLLSSVSKPCRDSLRQLSDALVVAGRTGLKNNTWAQKFVDATGKPGSGLLEGNQQVLGSFAECMDIGTQPGSQLQSRYCSTVIGSKPNSTTKSSPEMVSSTPGFSIGTCLPAQCNTDDVTVLISVLLNQTMDRLNQPRAVAVLNSHCDSNVDTWYFNGPAIVAIIILAVSAFLLVSGTLVDAGLRYLADRQAVNNPSDPTLAKDIERSSIILQLLLCWSAIRNGNKILTVETQKSVRSGDAGVPPLHSIHGIRFVSMCWVVHCHTYAFSVGSMKDPVRFINDVGQWYFQPLSNASFSVDTFLFLSGMLLAYVVTAQERHHRRINWIQYYIHRYWRLTPPYILTLAVLAGLFKYLAWGPFWNPNSWFPDQCASSWWTNLLYVNNFFQLDKGCMAWSWYLANDMQFYIISPLFIIPFFYRKSFGIAAWSLLMVAFFVATIAITVVYKLPASFIAAVKDTGDKEIFWTYFTVYYVKPWTRIGPYLVGVAFGYILYQGKTRNWRLKTWQVLVGWPLSLAISAIIIFSLVNENAGKGHLSLAAASIYNILSRPFWGIILGFVIFACETGSGGYINSISSFPGFVPLSRLCYCTYLVHPAIQMWVFGAMTSQFSYSILTLSILSFGFIFASFCLAFVVSLAFESPALGLEKLITSMLSKNRPAAAVRGGADNGAFTHNDLAAEREREKNDEAGSSPTVRVSARRRPAVAAGPGSSVNNDRDIVIERE